MENKIPRSDKPRIQDVDFKFRDDLTIGEDETVRFELLLEPYQGVIYFYTGVGFYEDEQGTPHLRFGFNVIDSPDPNKDFHEDIEFKTILGDIIMSLFIEGTANDNNTKHREDGSEEPDTE